MSKQTEYDKHVEYVTQELVKYADYCVMTRTVGSRQAESRARDIVQWVSSKPAPWWKRLIHAQQGSQEAK